MKIIPLTKDRINEASKLLLEIFYYSKPEDFDYPPKWLEYSLSNKNKNNFEVGYWTVIENNKIIGITGLYNLPQDENEALWLAWTAVIPGFRGKGIGKKLLDLMIEKAKKQNKKYLRLYSGDGPIEKNAMILYKKKGFKITKEEPSDNANYPYKKIYMELKLN